MNKQLYICLHKEMSNAPDDIIGETNSSTHNNQQKSNRGKLWFPINTSGHICIYAYIYIFFFAKRRPDRLSAESNVIMHKYCARGVKLISTLQCHVKKTLVYIYIYTHDICQKHYEQWSKHPQPISLDVII